MRIRFSAPRANGVRVIEEIPDLKLCHIEGRNGIGKTLSVRLLELISGAQPYSTLPHAWKSLKDQLGPTTVVFTGLAEGEIEVLLTPDTWPDDPVLEIENLGSAKLSGKTISMERVRQLVHVHRIAGDETLSETLALELAEKAAHARQLDADVVPAIDAWDTELQDLFELVENIGRDRLKRLKQDLKASRKRSMDLEEDIAANADEIEATTAALAGLQHMDERRARLPTLLDALEAAAAELAEQDGAVETLTARLAALSAERDTDSIASDLRKWENRYRIRATALSKALAAEKQLLRALGLESRPSDAERQRLQIQAETEARDLQEKLNSLDSIGGLKSLLTDLDRTLSAAPGAVDDQLVLTEPAEISAEALRTGIRERQEELEGVPRPTEVEELFQRQRAADVRVGRILQLVDLATKTDRKKLNFAEAVETLSALWDQVEGSADLRPVSEELRHASDTRLSKAFAVVAAAQALVQLLGTGPIDTSSVLPVSPDDGTADDEAEPDDSLADPIDDHDPAGDGFIRPAPPSNPMNRSEWESIAAELDRSAVEALSSFEDGRAGGVGSEGGGRSVVDSLRMRFEALTTAARELEDEAAIARRDERAAQQALKAYGTRCDRSLTSLRADARWEPFRSGLMVLIGEPDPHDLMQVSGALGRVEEFVSEIRSHMAAVRGGLNQLAFYLDAESMRLTGRAEVGPTVESTLESFEMSRAQQKRIREWAEAQLADIVGTEALRNELFDKAPAVTVDLRRATVSWESPADGRVRQRPFEAFSSGEQVFAYTKAKLELLREHPPEADHIVVVLDEFGAFVARDRFGQLMQFVAEDALDTIAEQIVVILPLADDYLLDSNAEELAKAAGADHGNEYLNRIAQLADRDYFAIPASAS